MPVKDSQNSLPHDIYSARITQFTNALQILLAQDRSVVLYRTLTFVLLGGGGLFLGIKISIIYGLLVGFACIIALMYWAKRHSDLRFQQQKNRKLIEINQHEIECLNGKWSMFSNGFEYYALEPEHPFQRDLDLFGDNSLFQYLNRTATQIGSHHLAHLLQNPFTNPEDVNIAQKEIQRILPMVEFKQQWQAIGKLTPENPVPEESITYLSSPPEDKKPNAIKKIIPYIAIAMSLGGLLVGILTGFWSLLGLSFLLISVVSTMISRKQMLQDAEAISIARQAIKKNKQLLQLVITLDPHHPNISAIQKVVNQLHSLSQIANDFNAKSFPIVGMMMNGLLAWDVRCVERLRFWRIEHYDTIPSAQIIVSHTDYLQSIATYSYNNSTYIYPQIIPLNIKTLVWEAQNLGHPLIPPAKRISNNFKSGVNGGAISVITGSNMAGKSTFLRTIGVNHILGLMGAPVSASSMTISPLPLRTSMRTMDALHKNESLFYAELKRLKEIIDELRSQKPALLLLDEILKGTNSKDKLEGSFAYVKQLINLPTIALTATHDLELAQLRNEFTKEVSTYYFDFTLADDDSLKYDYQLKTGTPPTFNATILMKKMGIIP